MDFQQIFNNMTEEQRREFAQMFEQPQNRRQDFQDWIKQRCPLMNKMMEDVFRDNDEERDTRIRLILGKIQAGKTSFMTCYAMSNMVIRRRANIVIVMNANKHAEQFENACLDLFKDYERFRGDPVGYKLVLAGNRSKSTREDMLEVLGGDNGGIIVCLGNGAQLQTVLSIIREIQDEGERVCFDLFVDEADDYFNKPPTTVYDENLERIKLLSRKKFCVTATALSLVFSDKEMVNKLTFEIPIHPNYVGIDKINFFPLPHNRRPDLRKHGVENYFETDPYARDFYIDLGHAPKPLTQPIMILHKVSRFKDHHREFIHTFSTDPELRDRWTVISYNGDGCIVYSDCLRSLRVEVVVRQARKRVLKETGREVDIDSGDVCGNTGIHVFEKAPLRNVLTYLRLHTLVSHILIVSGDMADRGINFVCSEYRWHLTDLYYMSMSENTTEPSRIQAMRCCCIFPDDGIIPRVHAHPNDIIRIRASYEMQEHLFKQMLSMEEECVMNDEYRNVPVKQSWVDKAKKFGRQRPTFNVKLSDREFDARFNDEKKDEVKDEKDEKDEKEDEVKQEKEDENDGKYTVFEEDNLSGFIQKLLVREIISQLIEHQKINEKVSRPQVIKYLLDLGLPQLTKRSAIEGNLEKMPGRKTNDPNKKGLLYWKESGRLYIQLNM